MVISRWLRADRVSGAVLAAACVAGGVWRELQSGLFGGSPFVDRRAAGTGCWASASGSGSWAARCAPTGCRAAASRWWPGCRWRGRRARDPGADRRRRVDGPGHAPHHHGRLRRHRGRRRGRRRRPGGAGGAYAQAGRGADGHPDAARRRPRRHRRARPLRRPAQGGRADHVRPRRVRGAGAAPRRGRLPAQGRHRRPDGGRGAQRGGGRRDAVAAGDPAAAAPVRGAEQPAPPRRAAADRVQAAILAHHAGLVA